MTDGLARTAKRFAGAIAKIEAERQALAEQGLTALETADPETAKLALKVFVSRRKAASWLTHPVGSLEGITPWQCLADGKRDRVHNTLNAIAYGDYA